jgi:hypothetical protein
MRTPPLGESRCVASFLELDFSPERASAVKTHDDDAEDARGQAPFGHHNPRTGGSQLVRGCQEWKQKAS